MQGRTEPAWREAQVVHCRRTSVCARSTGIVSHNAFPDDVIALALRWYIRYRLSDADVVEWFAERGLVVDRSTV